MTDKIPVILDTDIGSDIDDALCLSYLLRQPRCELLGVTTVTGQPGKRAMLADAICRRAGRDDVPIHSGCPQPLLTPVRQPRAPQVEALENWPHRSDFEPNTAVEFLRRVIRRYPGEITLLAVGAMTNVGLLFATDPEIPRLLKQVVLMCGRFTNRLPGLSAVEWNAYNDPYALEIVYRSEVKRIVSIGLDVTCCCRIPVDEARGKLRGGPLDVVADMAEVWFRRADQIVFHDPLAATVIFRPDLCEYEGGKAEVELLSRQVLGMTHWTPGDDDSEQHIAVKVDSDAFFDHYFDVTGA